MKCRHFFVSIFLLMVVINETTHAQSQSAVSKQIWIDVNPSYFINPRFKIFGDIGARKEIENDGWWHFVVRPSIRTWQNDIM